jgi:hypothetical protein
MSGVDACSKVQIFSQVFLDAEQHMHCQHHRYFDGFD